MLKRNIGVPRCWLSYSPKVGTAKLYPKGRGTAPIFGYWFRNDFLMMNLSITTLKKGAKHQNDHYQLLLKLSSI